jgi:glutaredoxin
MQGLVTILANPECPHCVHATDLVTDWCCEMGLPVAGVDLPQHPEVARPWRLESSPAVVYEADGARRIFTGFPTHDEFVAFTGP